MNLIIGIDAGGTTTTGSIVTMDKEILFKTAHGMGNPAVDFDDAVKNIGQVLSDCITTEYGNHCQLIVAGVAGIEVGDNFTRLENLLKAQTHLPIVLLNDAKLAYASIYGFDDGVLTIAGTGSISIGVKGDRMETVGGWGHLLGDEGSSYHIVLEACKRIAHEIEADSHLSLLTISILTYLKITNLSELKRFIYNSLKGDIAGLSSFIYLQALNGDVASQKLFEKAGKDLALQTIKLINRLGFEVPPSITCKGSLLETNSYVYNSFVFHVQKKFPAAEVKICEVSPTIGAVAIAKRRYHH